MEQSRRERKKTIRDKNRNGKSEIQIWFQIRKTKNGVAAIVQWIRLCLPSCSPRFESQAYHLRFYQFIFELCYVEKTKISKKRCRDWPIFIKKLKIFLFIFLFLERFFLANASYRSLAIIVTESRSQRILFPVIFSTTLLYLPLLPINTYNPFVYFFSVGSR